MNRRTVEPPTTSASRTSTSGSLAASRASISVWMVRNLNLLTATKKAGDRPLSVRHPARSRSESCAASLAPPPSPAEGMEGLAAHDDDPAGDARVSLRIPRADLEEPPD